MNSISLLAAKFENTFSHHTTRIIQRIGAFILFLDSLFYIIYKADIFLAIFLFLFAFVATLFLWTRFVNYYRSAPPPYTPSPELDADTLIGCIDFEALRIFAQKESWNPHDILISLFDSPAKTFFINRLELDEKKLRAILQVPLVLAHDAKEMTLISAAALAKESRHEKIELSDILLSAVSLSQPFRQLILQEGFQPKDIEYTAVWYKNTLQHERSSLLTRLEHSYGIGKTWAFAFTPILNRFSRPITFQSADGEDLHIIIHSNEIGMTEEALAKSAAANALIVGEPGLGAMTIVKGLAERIARGQSFGIINYKRIIQLKLELIFGQENFGDIVSTITHIFHEAERAGNTIIVIDDIENYLSAQSKMNISEILIPFLKSTTVKIIGITNGTGFGRGTIENPELYSLFEKIELKEPDEQSVMRILIDTAIHKERHGLPVITYAALEKIYELSARYIADRPFPEKAIDLFEDTAIYMKSIGEKKSMRKEHVEAVIERKIKLPVGDIERGETDKLIHMEERLHARVVDQVEGISAIADAMRRSRTGLSSGKKPIGSFLFLGPTGVGKTETAKALAEIYFGNEERMIRFDMSEYQKISDLQRLIGSMEMREPGLMVNAIRENPLSLILLDEIEKAHPNILNLFLQILDEGHCTDAFGKRADFKNAIIIATSNAGAEFIHEALSQNTPYEELQKTLVDTVLKSGVFRPEFLNRFDRVVIFKPLSKDDTAQVAKLLLKALGKRITQQGYGFKISEETPQKLAEAVAGSVFGARELRRLIQDSIESKIAKDLLAGTYKKGDTIII